MKALYARSKVWLEVDGRPLLGDGRAALLTAIARCGSISAAAKELAFGYRRAWAAIDSMEKELGTPLVLREKGGAAGGRATLTVAARELLERFEQLRSGVREGVDEKFALIFGASSGEERT